MWLFDLLFSSIPQIWYVKVWISWNVSESPFKITRVDCTFFHVVALTFFFFRYNTSASTCHNLEVHWWDSGFLSFHWSESRWGGVSILPFDWAILYASILEPRFPHMSIWLQDCEWYNEGGRQSSKGRHTTGEKSLHTNGAINVHQSFTSLIKTGLFHLKPE